MNFNRIVISLLFIINSCCVSAAEPLTGETYYLADQAYKDISNMELEKAYTAVTSALTLSPNHPQLLAILAQVQTLKNEIDNAIESLTQALINDPENTQILAQRGYLYIRQNDYDNAINDFENALQTKNFSIEENLNISMALADLYANRGDYEMAVAVLSPLVVGGNRALLSKWQAYLIYQDKIPDSENLIGTPEVNSALINKAYDALREGNNEYALELFLLAERNGGLTSLQYGDAGYIARRLFRNQEATRLFIASIQLTIDEPDGENSLNPPLLFGLRRAVDDLNRNWGFIFSTITSEGGETAPGTFGQSGFTQAGMEIFYQPPSIGYRDGRQLQFFVRSFQTLDDKTGGAEGIDTNQGALGVRWKPLRDYNLVLTGERLFSIGKFANDDWLLRVGFSIDHGVDIQPFLKHWSYRTLFAEAAYFVDEERNIDNLETRWGHSFRLDVPKNLTVTPHLVFAADIDSAAESKVAAGIGIGTSLRWWFRETPYRAPASYIDLTVQYREGLIDDTNRQDGIFVRTILWY